MPGRYQSTGFLASIAKGGSVKGFISIDQYLEKYIDESIEELKNLVAQPSVGAQNWGIQECALLVANMLQKRGFSSEVIPTPGAPVVYGERKGKSDKTVLFYCHYDVQPPEPIELWESPPFEPTLRNGKLYGRGVSDDKGHLSARLFAIDALLSVLGDLPCTVKFLVEGEEETSSIHLHQFVRENLARLEADACIWEFGGVDHEETPIQYLGLRGICYVELSVETATIDVHSGLGGSIFPNAAWRLSWALNSLKHSDERIRIPGFYNKVKPPSARDIELMTLLPETADLYKELYGINTFIKGLTQGVDLRVEEVFTPTCTICGLTSGYQGEGSKTVLPAKASAKLDFRLVPDQEPEEVLAALRDHLDDEGFEDVQINFLGGESPARTDPDDPFVKLVCDTALEVYAKPMKLIPLSGGSGPNGPFVHDLGLPVVTAGLGYPDSRSHSPNENIRLDLYLKHARHICRILMEFGSNT
jgi:acetylornithine deacetylase/succinyl-diaminopimelate desuccinylase-like protein